MTCAMSNTWEDFTCDIKACHYNTKNSYTKILLRTLTSLKSLPEGLRYNT